MKAMKKEYDFSKAEKGKFYTPQEKIELPVYLDEKVKKYYLTLAKSRKITLEKVINIILRKEMELQKEIHKQK